MCLGLGPCTVAGSKTKPNETSTSKQMINGVYRGTNDFCLNLHNLSKLRRTAFHLMEVPAPAQSFDHDIAVFAVLEESLIDILGRRLQPSLGGRRGQLKVMRRG